MLKAFQSNVIFIRSVIITKLFLLQLKCLKGIEKKPSVKLYKNLNDCIVISSMDKSLLELSPKSEEVIVDVYTGQSVLRGSHIYAPGIMAMTSGKIS